MTWKFFLVLLVSVSANNFDAFNELNNNAQIPFETEQQQINHQIQQQELVDKQRLQQDQQINQKDQEKNQQELRHQQQELQQQSQQQPQHYQQQQQQYEQQQQQYKQQLKQYQQQLQKLQQQQQQQQQQQPQQRPQQRPQQQPQQQTQQRLNQAQQRHTRNPFLQVPNAATVIQPAPVRARSNPSKSVSSTPNSINSNASPPSAPAAGPTGVVRPAVAANTAKRSSGLNPHERFNTKLFHVIAPTHPYTNVVYSPLSLQTLLAFIYTGADQDTARELQQALELPDSKEQVIQIFQKLMRSQKIPAETQLIMANKLYHRFDLLISRNMKNVVAPKFDAGLEAIDFSYAPNAAAIINSWVAAKTQNRINNVITADILDPQTSAILVNAIYFKAKWEKEMSTLDTLKNSFYTSERRLVPADMMFIDNTFRYADLPDLQAQVVELPYKNSDMSMMILLPNDRDGLYELELNLKNIDLSVIADQMQTQMVEVRLPKFKIEFDLDMIDPLAQLGISRLFSTDAQLGGIFQKEVPVGISKVQHKAYLEVNEAGSEAAAAAFSKLIPLSLPPQSYSFNANHPFMFAIRSPRAVYFVGHVVVL